jgi:hypothetical protein
MTSSTPKLDRNSTKKQPHFRVRDQVHFTVGLCDNSWNGCGQVAPSVNESLKA